MATLPHAPEDLITGSPAARILGRSPAMVRRYADQGVLLVAARSTDGLRLYRRADVEALAARLPRRQRSAA